MPIVGSQGASAGDCSLLIRYAGETYNHRGFTEQDGVRLGDADWSECDDLGYPDHEPRGAFFPQDPRQVGVWSFEGFDPSEVVGWRVSDEPFRVFLAEGLSDAEAEKILTQLSRAHPDKRER